MTSTICPLPQHIQEDILDVVASSLIICPDDDDGGGDEGDTASFSHPQQQQQQQQQQQRRREDLLLQIESVEECKSAQQKVFIVRVATNKMNKKNVVVVVVLRMWYGGSCWWNLHRNGEHQRHLLADSEIMGYTVARRALNEHHTTNEKYPCHGCIAIPRVYKFVNTDTTRAVGREETNMTTSHDDRNEYIYVDRQQQPSSSSLSSQPLRPYAILQYVGPGSSSFLLEQNQLRRNGGSGHDNFPPSSSTTRTASLERLHLRPSTTYEDNMIKVRHEFGFDEPHPRWGRIPTNDALEYAQLILHQVVLPIHSYCFDHVDRDSNSKTTEKIQIATASPPAENNNTDEIIDEQMETYAGMVCRYRKAWKEMMSKIEQKQHQQQIGLVNHDHHDNGLKTQKDALGSLHQAIKVLEDNVSLILQPYAPVLVHLDLQPQNIKFGVHENEVTVNDDVDTKNERVVSVLDWEDAAWADPRFEMLMLCRKVCADMDQTNSLWSEYAQWYDEYLSKIEHGTKPQREESNNDTASTDITKWKIGPVRPWMQLETVHSITTLLLQSMDLLHGGRNPWETKSDLWGKLEREFSRWDLW
mmetsp:Transcript_58697/g.143555  ORF Transcript_58697/g.143555 Transcript_58697/m.143555 type:complete len:585 (+) Transcript_58697:60-1814(+)